VDPWIAGPVTVVGLILLGMAFFLWSSGATAAELEGRISREVEDSLRLASAVGLLEISEARRDTVAGKVQSIRDLDGRRYIWPRLMDEVSRALPPQAWLTALQASGGDSASPVVTVEGYAGSANALTRFMAELEGSPFLTEVSLLASEQVEREGRSVQRFTVEARYRRAEPAFIETVPVVAGE